MSTKKRAPKKKAIAKKSSVRKAKPAKPAKKKIVIPTAIKKKGIAKKSSNKKTKAGKPGKKNAVIETLAGIGSAIKALFSHQGAGVKQNEKKKGGNEMQKKIDPLKIGLGKILTVSSKSGFSKGTLEVIDKSKIFKSGDILEYRAAFTTVVGSEVSFLESPIEGKVLVLGSGRGTVIFPPPPAMLKVDIGSPLHRAGSTVCYTASFEPTRGVSYPFYDVPGTCVSLG